MYLARALEDPLLLFVLVGVAFSICCHEYMHARIALAEGDPTAADAGHLTLNPLRQMGWVSLVMLAVAGIAWGAVPVNPRNFRRPSSALRVALAGPLANLALWALFLLASALLCLLSPSPAAPDVLFRVAVTNAVLFLFNLLPVPGLDGSTVLRHFFPAFSDRLSPGVSLVLLILLFRFSSYLFDAAWALSLAAANLLSLLLPAPVW
jgi:Zn-dependent protease